MDAIAKAFAPYTYFTVFYGESVTGEAAEEALAILQKDLGDNAELTLIRGGQPVYDYVISAE